MLEQEQQRRIAGRYLLGGELGHGGMGTVWRATDELLGREVAVKEIELPAAVTAPGQGQSQDAATVRARVLREARAAARLNHPGIVTVHDVLDAPDRLFIVMELVEAPSLAGVVAKEGPLPPARVARIGLGLVDALEAAHAAGIVHRDVKPGNVLLLPGDQVKLADFGIAAIQGDPQLTASRMVLGSPAFMAPEQAGAQPVGPPADYWALGATLYFSVEGRPPFPREHPVAVLAAIIHQQPAPTRHAGPLAPVITALLAKSPESRPSGARLRELLQHAADAGANANIETEAQTTPQTAPPTTQPVTEAMPAPVAQPMPGLETMPGSETGPLPLGGTGGTITRRRPRAVAGSVLAAALIALALWLWHSGVFSVPQPSANSPSHSHSGADSGQAERSSSATTPPRATSSTTASQAAGGSGQGSSESTATTVGVPSTLPTTEQAAAGQVLPKFWTSATNQAGGYSVGVPQTWQVSATGTTTDVARVGEREFEAAFQVRVLPRTQDPLRWLKAEAASFAAANKANDYTQVHLKNDWTYKGQPASAWEYTWFHNGEKTHARWIAFHSGGRTFAVFYRSRDVFWLGEGSAVWPEGFEQAFTLK